MTSFGKPFKLKVSKAGRAHWYQSSPHRTTCQQTLQSLKLCRTYSSYCLTPTQRCLGPKISNWARCYQRALPKVNLTTTLWSREWIKSLRTSDLFNQYKFLTVTLPPFPIMQYSSFDVLFKTFCGTFLASFLIEYFILFLRTSLIWVTRSRLFLSCSCNSYRSFTCLFRVTMHVMLARSFSSISFFLSSKLSFWVPC